ncbi:T6SS immunity protein Tli4 family protein [Escherichia coli]
MEKNIILTFLSCAIYSAFSNAESIVWKDECVGYYQLQLPDDIEVGLYPVERIYTENTIGIDAIFGQYYRLRNMGKNVSGRYSGFYYENYRLMVSKDNFMDLNEYKIKLEEKLLKHSHNYIMKNFPPDAFFISYENSHSLFYGKAQRLYQVVKAGQTDIIQAGEGNINLTRDVDVHSFIDRFRARKFYEIPSEHGFCLPYGFIADKFGEKERNMVVTYRMNSHPDVMIIFQDASYQLPAMIPDDSDGVPLRDYDARDYAKWLWNNVYMLYPEQKRKLLSPGWFSITMDGRKGSGSFLEVTRRDGEKDYGYLAFVRANPQNSTKEPDLQVFVTSYSELADDHPQITRGELKTLAEHIVNSVKHRE